MNDKPVLTKLVGEFKYEVFYDEDDFFHSFDNEGTSIDFETKEEKEAYKLKFIKEELFAFGVVRMKVCECCCLWSAEDSLWGIHEESPESALKYYLGEFNG